METFVQQLQTLLEYLGLGLVGMISLIMLLVILDLFNKGPRDPWE